MLSGIVDDEDVNADADDTFATEISESPWIIYTNEEGRRVSYLQAAVLPS